jgi:hypothetical protein
MERFILILLCVRCFLSEFISKERAEPHSLNLCHEFGKLVLYQSGRERSGQPTVTFLPKFRQNREVGWIPWIRKAEHAAAFGADKRRTDEIGISLYLKALCSDAIFTGTTCVFFTRPWTHCQDEQGLTAANDLSL